MTTREAELPQVAARVRPGADTGVAVGAAVVALLCLVRAGADGDGLIAGFLAFVLVWLAAIDLRERILPNRIVLPATAVVLVAHAALTPRHFLGYAFAALAAAAVFFLPAVLRPGALGMGDVKLALLLGAALGSSVVPALTIGLFLVGLFAAGLVAANGRAALKTQVPLGPFLAFGAILLLLV
jgi:leader peptidase (prepilin peptidase)/N-methyltransferase